jgi:hypothetical protein
MAPWALAQTFTLREAADLLRHLDDDAEPAGDDLPADVHEEVGEAITEALLPVLRRFADLRRWDGRDSWDRQTRRTRTGPARPQPFDGGSGHCDRVVTLAGAAADSGTPWMAWVLGGLAIWLVVGFGVAVVVGRGIRHADRMAAQSPEAVDLAPAARPALAPVGTAPVSAAPARRLGIPVPPIRITLVAVAMALETTGFFLRLTGNRGSIAQVFSMDAPLSLPRMYVAALFAAAAVLAVAGAGTLPGRRTWWLAVGLIGGGIAAVKAGGTVHVGALTSLEAAVGGRAALVVSVLAAGAVVAGLLFLSRSERRDRRRIVGVLVLYAGASVGLSAISSAMPTATLAASATFVEETGEALAGVGFLLAVLAGVAPRLVLPAAWRLRRAADAHTLEVAEPLGARTPASDVPR